MKTIKHLTTKNSLAAKHLKYFSSGILKPEIPCLSPQIKTQIK